MTHVDTTIAEEDIQCYLDQVRDGDIVGDPPERVAAWREMLRILRAEREGTRAADLRAEGRREERERVVQWLREWGSVGRTDTLYMIAEEAERGDHWRGGEGSKLWAVEVQGPGSLIAQPDRETAERRASEWQEAADRSRADMAAKKPDTARFMPEIRCVVIEWPHKPETHAEELAEHGGEPEDIC